MKPVCCDTSFLVALYGNDSHSSEALRIAGKLAQPLTLTDLHEFELEQTLRLAVWRKMMTPAEMARALALFHADCASGLIISATPDVSRIVKEARRLSARYTQNNGHRIFDILLVAAALELGAAEFLTFDANQRKLAHAERLKVRP
jgi:predicted nucleic acid-binding protein